jgi:hypothetical protein
MKELMQRLPGGGSVLFDFWALIAPIPGWQMSYYNEQSPGPPHPVEQNPWQYAQKLPSSLFFKEKQGISNQ